MGCGLVAMLGVQQILSGGNGAAAPETVQVLVAKQEINPGFELDERFAEFQAWPKENVPPGAVTEREQYEKRALKVRAFPGEVILQAKLGEKGVFGASAAIKQGMRVQAVRVDNTSAISGLIRPGDRVDILVTYKFTKPGGLTVTKTKTVLQFVEVFAVDRNRDSEGGDQGKAASKAENISVIVTPQQSQVLMNYVSKGTLQMALRNPEDNNEVNAGTVDDSSAEDPDAPKQVASATGKHQPVSDSNSDEKEEKVEPKPETFKTFLNAEAAPQTPPPEPAKKFWDIKIYEGETFRVEKVELPDDNPGVQVQSPLPAKEKSVSDKPAATAA